MSKTTHKNQPLLVVSRRAIADRHHNSAHLGETATIEVGTGENRQTFYIHRDLLLFYSGYFKGALNGGFAEANSGIVKPNTEEPAVFAGFVKWLYTQKARKDQIT